MLGRWLGKTRVRVAVWFVFNHTVSLEIGYLFCGERLLNSVTLLVYLGYCRNRLLSTGDALGGLEEPRTIYLGIKV